MSQRRARTASVSYRSDYQQNMPALGIVPLRPSPAPATIVQNLAASLIGNIQEDVRCACHIGKSLYTGDTQGTILQWNPLDASRTTFFDGLGAPVNVVLGVNENKDIWTGLTNGYITILSLDTKTIKSQLKHAHDAAVNCITAGIQCAWSGGDDFLIKKWDLDGVELVAYNQHHGFIKDVLILRNDPADSHVKLWVASSDATISVAALEDNRAQDTLLSNVKMLSGHSKGVSALCLVGADAIWSGCEDGSIGVWSSLGVLTKHVQQAHKGPVRSFVVMGVHVWSGSGDHTVLVWESSSCQLMFSLGDQGGFIKSMASVDYMCWIFTSGKNIRIWCAQSVWDTYEGQKDRLNRSQQRLKEALEKAQTDKQSIESAKKKSQQDLQAAQQQMNEQRDSGAFALEKKNAEIEKLMNEHAKTLEDLEVAKANAQTSAGSLDGEITVLLEKLSKLKAEKEAGEKAAKVKAQGLEKDSEKLGKKHKKAEQDLAVLKTELANMKTELQTAQGDLESCRKEKEDLLVNQNLDNQKAAELEKSLAAANVRNTKLESELARSTKGKEEADKAITGAQAGYEQQRAELEGRIKQLQEDLDRAHENANVSRKANDVEMQKLQGELKKKSKELKRKMKEVGEDKRGSAKEIQELKDIIDQLKKSQDASSYAEASTNEKLSSLALELQNARDDMQKTLRDKTESLEERDTESKKMNEDHLKSMNDLQVENENLQELIKENEKVAGASKEAYQQACALLANASKEKDEAAKDAAGLRQRLQALEQNMMQAKDSAAASEASSQALAKERDDLLKRLNDAASETEKLKNELLQLSQSAASKASALDELRKTGENDFQESEQKRTDLEKRLEDDEKKTSEELAKLSDAIDILNKEESTMKELLAQASAEIDKLRMEKTSQEYSTAQVTQELNQLKKDKATVDDKVALKAAKLERVSQELDQIKKEKAAVDQDSDQIKTEKATLDEKFAQKTAELEQELLKKSSHQTTSTKMSEEIEELKAQKLLLEENLSASVSELEELKKATRSHEGLSAQKAVEFNQMLRELERLRCEITQKEEEYRLANGSAVLAAADAARLIEELQNKIVKMGMKSEDTLPRAQAALVVDDPVWARIRELETALTQAHMDYRLLNREFRHMRKKRGRYTHSQTATAENKPHWQSDGLNVDFRMIQPGFSIDYTKLKVSSAGDQGRAVTNIGMEDINSRLQLLTYYKQQTMIVACGISEAVTPVCGQTPNPGTPRRIIPIHPPVSHPETPQRTVPIRAPSPAPEMIQLVVTPKPQPKEKERYFPSHGPMRVRRGLSPGRER